MVGAARKSFIKFDDLPTNAAMSVLERAGILARAFADRRMPQSLQGRRVALIVDDGGWRNTTAFELGVEAMGGVCVQSPIRFKQAETTADIAGYLDNWFDLLIVRTKELATLQTLSACAESPVINARTRVNHPCETLGDLAYIHSVRGGIDGLNVVVIAADGNILRSWVEASQTMPIRVTQVSPEIYHIRDTVPANPSFAVSTDIRHLLDADVIVTDAWPDDAGSAGMSDFQISASLLDRARPELIFLPCPPVTRGQEVTADAMLHPVCQSLPAKAFLLHAQNALMEWIVS